MNTWALWAAVLASVVSSVSGQYEPNWDSLNKRPLPSWYDEAKFGIFIHWGVFSVPSFGSEWFWNYWASGSKGYVDFMKQNYPPKWTYADFASQFTAEFYNPDQWADIFQASGAKYIVLTSKHHEGFCNWHTNVSFNWNSVAVGPKRDLVGDLAKSIRNKTDIRFGLYHSLFEWFNPMYLADKASGFKTQNFVNAKTMPELYELVNMYKPDVIWSDGSVGPDTYFKSTEFIAWLYNSSPVKDSVVINDRWGTGCSCHDGGYWTCSDRFNPGHVLPHKWENCMTIDKGSWGYRRNTQLSDYLTMEDLVTELVETVSCGGNLLMNIGPTHDGRIMPVFEERLRGMGEWLGVNGEAIYSTIPWKYQKENDTKGLWYTSKKESTGATSVYAIALNWPTSDLHLALPTPTSNTMVTLLGYPTEIKWSKGPSVGMTLKIPVIAFNQMPCKWGWVFKMTNLM